MLICQFGALRDDLIQDEIMVGMREKKLSEQLQPGFRKSNYKNQAVGDS